jgi:DNA-binding NarL/FixJ family response regulator
MKSFPVITVAIVEDNAAVGVSLQKIVEAAGNLHFMNLWTSGMEALEKIAEHKPQVVLMDINLPDISGIEVTARVKQRFPEIQIIMMTVYRDHDKIFAALRAGASGYLLKRSSAAEIRAALTGGAPISAEIAHRIVETFHEPVRGHGHELDLSRRETDVMQKLSEGLGNHEIAEQLGITYETVRVHLKRVYKKLHVRSRTQAVLKFGKSFSSGPRGG